MDEKDLVSACIKKEQLAFQFLYESYSPYCFGIVLRYARDTSEAEDMLQEGFARVFKDIGSFRFEGSLKSWVGRIIVRSALDYIRKHNKVNLRDLDKTIKETHSYIDAAMVNLEAEEIVSLIQKLQPIQRTVFNLYAIEGFNHREIAEELNINENTSRSHYRRARVELQSLYLASAKVSKAK